MLRDRWVKCAHMSTCVYVVLGVRGRGDAYEFCVW